MATLLCRAISLLPKSQFPRFRYASSTASLPSAPHIQKNFEQKLESPESTQNCCNDVPCPTRKLESSSSSPCSIRTDTINIDKALESAVQQLQLEPENHLTEEKRISFEYRPHKDRYEVCFRSKAPGEIIRAHVEIRDAWDNSWTRNKSYLYVKIDREDGFNLEHEEKTIDNWLWYEGIFYKWQKYLQCSKDLESAYEEELRVLMTGRIERYVESIKRRKRDEQLAWMQNVKDFIQN